MEQKAPMEDKTASEIIEIRILNLGSATSFTLQANKQSLVSELKGQIASMVGKPAEHHRIIYGGKVLEDNQLLSSYKIEDGHALHLVITEPVPPLPSRMDVQPAAGQTRLRASLLGGMPSHPVGRRTHRGAIRRVRHIPDGEFRATWEAVRLRLNNVEGADDGETGERASPALLGGTTSHPVSHQTHVGELIRRRNLMEEILALRELILACEIMRRQGFTLTIVITPAARETISSNTINDDQGETTNGSES